MFTILIPSSPIRSHPSTEMVEQTIRDLRVHTEAEILLGIDGVRPEQEYLREAYEEYTRRVMWKAHHEWRGVYPIVYREHKHQSGMLLDMLPRVKTPLLMYVEHDTPLTPDREIDWDKCFDLINRGEAYTIRFHFENVIPKEHEGLMIDGVENGFLKTIQWSQRPHLSTTRYYRDVVAREFSESSKTMIEDKFHGVVWNDYLNEGIHGWYRHRLWIYHPENGIQRSYNLDGRGDEPKYKMKF